MEMLHIKIYISVDIPDDFVVPIRISNVALSPGEKYSIGITDFKGR